MHLARDIALSTKAKSSIESMQGSSHPNSIQPLKSHTESSLLIIMKPVGELLLIIFQLPAL